TGLPKASLRLMAIGVAEPAVPLGTVAELLEPAGAAGLTAALAAWGIAVATPELLADHERSVTALATPSAARTTSKPERPLPKASRAVTVIVPAAEPF